MEVLCHGRVGDLLAELSGRGAIELLGRYTGCVIIIDAFLVRSPARTVIGNQTVDGYRRDPRRPGHLVGEE